MPITNETLDVLIAAGIPMVTTIVSSFVQMRRENKHAAKQSILQMILEDEMAWEMFRKFPTNYGHIHDEYATYHKNGGNGEVTKKVNDYDTWYKNIEDSNAKLKEKK